MTTQYIKGKKGKDISKNCKHEWRVYSKLGKKSYCFYCIKCLIFTIKYSDFTEKEIINKLKKLGYKR